MELKEKVRDALNQIRPMLQADGGDLELLDVTDEGLVKIHLTGACGGCPFATMTLKQGIEARLKEMIPDVSEVISV